MGKQDDNAMLWAGPPDGGLMLVPMDMLTMVYDRRSAQTHVVASPLPEILAVLGQDRCAVAEILARLSTSFDIETSDDVVAILQERLHEMAALGLVTQQP